MYIEWGKSQLTDIKVVEKFSNHNKCKNLQCNIDFLINNIDEIHNNIAFSNKNYV